MTDTNEQSEERLEACKSLGYTYEQPVERRWCVTHEQAMGKCIASRASVAPPGDVGISWTALLGVLERLRSKNRNPDNVWYHGWNAAIQCLINDINARSSSPPSSPVPPEQLCFCGGPKDDPIHEYTFDPKRSHSFVPKPGAYPAATPTPVEQERPNARLWGELLLDANGEAHFICHTKDEDFAATKTAFEKFIALLQGQIANQKECPFYIARQEPIRSTVIQTGEHSWKFCVWYTTEEDAKTALGNFTATPSPSLAAREAAEELERQGWLLADVTSEERDKIIAIITRHCSPVPAAPNHELRSACCDAPTRTANTDYNVCTACKEPCDTVIAVPAAGGVTDKDTKR